MPIADLTPHLKNDRRKVIEKTFVEVEEIVGQPIPQRPEHPDLEVFRTACLAAGYAAPILNWTQQTAVFNRIYVWEQVREAAMVLRWLNNGQFRFRTILKYISRRYPGTDPNTARYQTAICTVNRESRVTYPQNSKPRPANGQYDFLYRLEDRRTLVWYDPAVHGQWEIIMVNGRPRVHRIGGNMPDENPVNNYPTTRRRRLHPAREDIPRPSPEEVRRYLAQLDALPNYIAQESALNRLFREIAPLNTSFDDVLIKIAALNEIYSINIPFVYNLVRHIVNLNIDARLRAGDETLVEEIARTGHRVLFSFATRYCNRHNEDSYPIYDSFVQKMLCYLRNVDGFTDFTDDKLRDFPTFKQVLLQMRQFYGLEAFTITEIDKYLWQLGKEKFPKKKYFKK